MKQLQAKNSSAKMLIGISEKNGSNSQNGGVEDNCDSFE